MSEESFVGDEWALLFEARVIARRFGVVDTDYVASSELGLTNRTFLFMHSEPGVVLQRVSEECHKRSEYIDEVLRHLDAKNVYAPRLLRSPQGDLGIKGPTGWWRLSTLIPGYTIDSNPSVAQARSAATLLAEVHNALQDFQTSSVASIADFPNVAKNVEKLSRVSAAHQGQVILAVERASTRVLQRYSSSRCRSLRGEPRLVHGDPKPSNFIFKKDTTDAVALVDYDTVGYYPLAVEIGDMLRAFCAVRGTMHPPAISPVIWEAVLSAYAENSAAARAQDWAEINIGFELVTIELAARCMVEIYEAGNCLRAHSISADIARRLRRANDMLLLLDDYQRQRDVLEAMIEAWHPGRMCGIALDCLDSHEVWRRRL